MLAAFALANVCLSSAAHGQLAVDRAEIFIDPSTSTSRVAVITVSNTSSQPVQAMVRLEDWDRSVDGNNQWHSMGSVRGSCRDRLSVFPLSINVAGGATQSLRVSLKESDAARDECWNAVMIEAAPTIAKGNEMSYVIRTAVKVYVEPKGLKKMGEVTDLKIVSSKPGVREMEVWFRNSGERHYIAQGSIEFRRADNSVAAKVALPDYYILPGAEQRGRVALPSLPPGEYVALALIDFGGDEIAAMQLEHVVRANGAEPRK